MSPEKAVAAFRDAVWAPASWPDALEAVATAYGSTMVTIASCSKQGELTCSRNAQPAIDLYLQGHHAPDSRQSRVNPTLSEGFRTDYDDFDPAEIAQDPYYQEFLVPLGVRWHAVAALPGLDERLVISIKRSSREGPFERQEVEVLNRALPHLRSAARHAALITRSRFEGEIDAFSHLNRGAICLDRDGCIVAINSRVIFGDGLLSSQMKLSAAFGDDRVALSRAISAASGTGTDGRAPAPSLVIVHRPSGKRPYVIDVFAVPAGDIAGPKRTRTLLVVNDLDSIVQPRRETMQRAFGMTPREADLADRLATGATLKEAAGSLQISEQHARQRLKSVFAKTGTSRQALLLAVLGRLC